MLRILAPVVALGLIASPSLAAAKTTTHQTHKAKPMAKKAKAAKTTTATTPGN